MDKFIKTPKEPDMESQSAMLHALCACLQAMESEIDTRTCKIETLKAMNLARKFTEN